MYENVLSKQPDEMHPAPHDLTRILKRTVDYFKTQVEASGMRVTLDMVDDPVLVDIDHKRIRQVTSNLLSEALKYNKAGGDIIVRLLEQRDYWVVEFVDQGIGLPPALQDVINSVIEYDPSVLEGDQGTGLSIYVAKQIVELHGGQFWARSVNTGRGSTFAFSLPKALNDKYSDVSMGKLWL
jgi:signal transduction histidine kinase